MKTYIKELRKERGWTQAELAHKAGLSKNTIYSYESGKRNPTLCGLDNIAKALNCPVKKLIEGKSHKKVKPVQKNPLPKFNY